MESEIKKKGFNIVLKVLLSSLALAVLLYVALHARIDLKYHTFKGFRMDSASSFYSDEGCSVISYPLYFFTCNSYVEKEYNNTEWGSITARLVVNEDLFGRRMIRITIHDENYVQSVTFSITKDNRMTRALSTTTPLSEQEKERVKLNDAYITDILEEGNRIWDLELDYNNMKFID